MIGGATAIRYNLVLSSLFTRSSFPPSWCHISKVYRIMWPWQIKFVLVTKYPIPLHILLTNCLHSVINAQRRRELIQSEAAVLPSLDLFHTHENVFLKDQNFMRDAMVIMLYTFVSHFIGGLLLSYISLLHAVYSLHPWGDSTWS